jgi:dihydropteroate synthase
MESINCKGKILTLDEPRIMGIVNCTPDSLYNSYGNQAIKTVLGLVEKMILEEVDIVDVGGFSTRPGAEFISEEEELKRIIPIIQEIHQKFPNLIISVDTFREKVAKEAVFSGASIVNDVSGGIEPSLFTLCAEHSIPYILMHIKGEPTKMMDDTHYDALVPDIYRYLSEKIAHIQNASVRDIVLDLGFGFSKTLEQNYALFNHIDFFNTLQKPMLVGISRKSMLTKLLRIENKDALNATSVLNTIALVNGAHFLRVHDVKEAVEIKKIVACLAQNK